MFGLPRYGSSVFLGVLLIPFAGIVSAEDVHLFGQGSYQAILKENEGQPFLLSLWSIDCPPCHQEMAMLGKFLKRHPQMKLILIGTDQRKDLGALKSILDKYQLGSTQNWVFSQDVPERLRYEIDPRWYGELPRSYFFDAAHARIAKSGQLTEEVVMAWWNAVSAKPAAGGSK